MKNFYAFCAAFFRFFITFMFFNFLSEMKIEVMFTTLNTKHRETNEIKLTAHEKQTSKNCGTRHLNRLPTKFPSILLGIVKMLIKMSGFKIMLFMPRYLFIILIFKMLERIIEIPVPTMKASIPRYFGKRNMLAISVTLPII